MSLVGATGDRVNSRGRADRQTCAQRPAAGRQRAARCPPPRDRQQEDFMRTTSLVIGAIAAAVVAGTAAAQAQDPNLARNLAATCANCHGTNGVSQGGVESLAGAGKDDMIRKLKEYKAGTKPGTIMPQLAKGYTDAQIDLVAGWFASQKPAK
jgi:sulfide dehydrogenase cytochrome subunit